MKVKKKLLLPLMLLFTLMMTCSAFAKPRLSQKTITFVRRGASYIEGGSKEYGHAMFLGTYCDDDIYLIGFSKDAYMPVQKVVTANGTLKFESLSVGSMLKVLVSFDRREKNFYRGMAGVKEDTVVEGEYKRDKTYKVKLVVMNNNKRVIVGPVKIRFRNKLAKTISYLKIGNKKFTTPFRSSNSDKIIDLKGVPTGKPVKITFKTSGQLKNAKYFTILRTRKAYKNGSKVVLKKGDVIMIGDKPEYSSLNNGSVPIFINVNHTKYKVTGQYEY